MLTALLLVSALPPALAVSDGVVLTSIGHSSSTTFSFSDSSRSATLYVPYSYSGQTLDLTNGLKITYDESLYQSVVAVASGPAVICSASDPDTSNPVQIKVSYHHVGDSAQALPYQVVYSVRVVRLEAQGSVFSGEITRQVKAGNTLSITAVVLKEAYQKNDGPGLDHFVIRGSNLVVGTLSYSVGDVLSTSIQLDSAGNILGNLTFTGASDGEVSYYVDAYEKDASTPLGTALLTITVDSTPTVKSPFAGINYVGTTLKFSTTDFSSIANLWGGTVQSVEITPNGNAYGTWNLNATTLTDGVPCEIDVGQIGNLTFTGSTVGAAQFTWRITTASGTSDYGSGSIAVSDLNLSLSSYSAASLLTRGGTWAISSAHFSYSPASVPLSYLKIVTIPSSADGYLCLSTALAKDASAGYAAISANTALKAGTVIPSSYIAYLRLVSTSSGTGSSLSFKWTATASSNASSAIWATEASYTVNFASGGNVSYSTSLNIPLSLDKSDFMSSFSNQSGYSLSYIAFSQTSQTGGKLYYNYNLSSKTGTAVSTSTKYYVNSSPNLSQITFVPTANFIGTVTFSYKAYRASGDSLSGTLNITVSNSSGGVVSYTADKNGTLSLDAADFSSAFSNATGETLSYIKLSTPTTKNGSFYYNYTSASSYDYQVSSSTKFYVRSSPYLSYISFVPYQDYTGTVSVSFTGYSTAGNSYTGKLVLFVVDSPAGIVSYSCKTNGAAVLQGDDFADEFIRVTGSVLSYVLFTPPANTVGTLYSQYDFATAKGTTIASNTKFYNGLSPDLSDITFVPAKDYTGNAEIKYTVYTSSGASYVGKLKIAVGVGSSGAVSYSTDLNTMFFFRASDFTNKFYANTGGAALSYVTFTLPSASYGTLYYNTLSTSGYGTAITGGKAYGVNTAPYLSNVTFVPRNGYTGSFSISYTGYTADGTGYPGKVTISVGGGGGFISYSTDSLTKVTFNLSDFREVFSSDVGTTLSYVKFSPPSSDMGTLYYSYSSSSSNTEVSSGKKYYASSYPYLSSISFVPNAAFSGTVSIGYVAYDSSGQSDSGTVYITVNTRSGGTVTYSGNKNVPVSLDANDFKNAFSGETDSTLSYVKFTLPSSTSGSLRYQYTSSSSGSAASSSQGYYVSSSPRLSDLTFVPAKDYVGTVTIYYKAYPSSGEAYSGQLKISLLETDPPPFSDVDDSYSWAAPAISYLYKTGVIQGYQSGLFHPGDSLSRGDFILMVVRGFDLTANSSDGFSDVAQGSYYSDAIATAKALGVALGSGGRFYPDTNLSRQDAAVILARAMTAAGRSLASASDSQLSGYRDADSVSAYAVPSVAALVKAGVLQGNGSMLHPKQMISRAEMSVILFRALAASE